MRDIKCSKPMFGNQKAVIFNQFIQLKHEIPIFFHLKRLYEIKKEKTKTSMLNTYRTHR